MLAVRRVARVRGTSLDPFKWLQLMRLRRTSGVIIRVINAHRGDQQHDRWVVPGILVFNGGPRATANGRQVYIHPRREPHRRSPIRATRRTAQILRILRRVVAAGSNAHVDSHQSRGLDYSSALGKQHPHRHLRRPVPRLSLECTLYDP